mmetsp:Transcript_23156/g.64323  ORF Transcript_23156/g.64323 Transcript_23156/m.64323 type:complete len:267 (-) Transcript_23156:144-944(-)|eukprot:CAMPEP_0117652784 /NCGR_PEP_ID=MMETSP0804-20121206/2822_1 /TAXON_ID=1074897 /ORGANISM="Tetraselmis astigmatica, Strain CCMP880" /LENGTH=266 /DNA_ID=CAMNT_0005458875 /DNA_START=305 /DNA_END=1105 /DNA_ORIENTATION=-
MGFAYWFGSLLLGLGPGLVIYARFVGRKSFLVLLSLASSFFWLLSLFAIASVFRAFVPLPSSAAPYSALLIVSVGIQEALRILVHWIHRRLLVILNRLASTQELPPLNDFDEHELALSLGIGHGLAHSVFFFLSFMQLALGDGTYYLEECPQISFFVASALSSLSFLLMHTFGMMVSFEGIQQRKWLFAGLTPALHMGSALLTLANFTQGGCVIVIPVNLTISVVPAILSGLICWRCAARNVSAGYAIGSSSTEDPQRALIRPSES